MKNDLGIRRHITSQAVAVSTTAASSTAVGAFCTVARISSLAPCFFRVGGVATVTNSAYLPADTVEFIRVNPGETISFIVATGTTTAYVTEME